MMLREVSDQQQWDAWAASVEHATFLQSWAWGEGQAALGKRVKRFAMEEKGEVLFIAQAIEHRRRGLSYWLVPWGPIQTNQNQEYRREAVDVLCKELLRGRAVFVRMEPLFLVSSFAPSAQEESRLASKFLPPSTNARYVVLSTTSFNPAIHWMLDLRGKTPEQLLKDMEQKTRYNVRLGERQGVTTRLSTDVADIDAFLHLMHQTAQRDGFRAHTDGYLRTTFAAMAKTGMAKIRVAECQEKILAASVEVLFGDTVTYLHGASSSDSRETKAPNVLQWEAIKDAVQNGYDWYDFGGCNPKEATDHLYKKSLEGVTRFKEGWGGGRVEMAGTFVVPRFKLLARFFK